jgi:uncharacterized membrane protein YkoI
MFRNKQILFLVGLLVVSSMAVVGFEIKARGKAKAAKVGIPAEQVISSIRTAIVAKPGSIVEIETDKEVGRTICEIEILAADGKTYEVAVDVLTNTVVEVEEDDDNDRDRGRN